MTLIELIISISVLGIIIGPITMSMMLGLINGTGTKERISDSVGAQLLSAYFPVDVQSSKTVEAPTSAPGTTSCGGGAGMVRLRLTWVDPTAPTDTTKASVVEYVDRGPDALGLHALWRIECDGGSPAVQRSQQRLVNSLDFASLPGGVLPVSCNSPEVACPATASGTPTIVTINVASNANSGTGPKANTAAYDPYIFKLQALRRETPS